MATEELRTRPPSSQSAAQKRRSPAGLKPFAVPDGKDGIHPSKLPLANPSFLRTTLFKLQAGRIGDAQKMMDEFHLFANQIRLLLSLWTPSTNRRSALPPRPRFASRPT